MGTASHLGGRRFVELYGSPGTPEGRRRGGLATQKRLRSDPGFAKKVGLKTRKRIRYPQKSPLLAEFVGIMLGDGGCHSDYQFVISFNPKRDLEYAQHIQRLITKLFSVSSTIDVREKYGSGDIIVNGKNLVEFLNEIGIGKGNKVVKQIDIPQWIFVSKDYKIACLRGLMDTDGSLYEHKYTINDKEYTYLKMCFTSYSRPLLRSVTSILKSLGFNPKNTAKNRVYLYMRDQINKYFEEVRTNNPRYMRFCNNFVINHK